MKTLFSKLKASLAVALVLAISSPVQAAITYVGSPCSITDISGSGITVTDCAGYYSGNLNNASDFSDVKTLLETEFSGLTLGSSIIEQLNPPFSSPINFTTPVFGDTVVGVHWGGRGGGDTAFYRLTIGDGYTGLNVGLINPFLEQGGLSNVALYSTAPVPEPETYAMMMAGLGLIGFISRRRKNV